MRRKRIEKASREAFRSARHASVGLELGVSVIIGCLFGLWVDDQLESKPWGLFGGLALGLVAAVRSIMSTLAAMKDEANMDEHSSASAGTVDLSDKPALRESNDTDE